MSTKDYILKPVPGQTSSHDWIKEFFYKEAVVLGIDIGLEGIGLWLRIGWLPIYGRTFLFETPDAAPLEGRRGLRAGRRCRQAEQRREVMLKQFCADFGLPWVEITDKGHDEGPFRFRWLATRKDTDGLRDVRAFSACLRHIINHRGYDWHSPEDGGDYPWGDEAKAKDAIEWAKTAFCKQERADELRYRLTDCGWKEKEQLIFEAELKKAVDRYNNEGIDVVLARHFAEAKTNLRPSARRYNFPREMVQEHLNDIVERHSQFLGGNERVVEVLTRLDEIINDHRKDEAARQRLFLRKVNTCPLAEILFDGAKSKKCDPNKDQHIRRFKLMEFLARRTFIRADNTPLLANEPAIRWVLDELLEADVKALESDGKIPRTKIHPATFRKQFTAKHDPTGNTELAGNTKSHNGEYFTELTDLIWQKPSVLADRATLCAHSAQAMFDYVTKDGFAAERIAARLKEKRFDNGGRKMSYYEIRQTAAAGFGIYKQVEFLLGRWKKNAKPGDKPAVPGKLRQIFEQLIKEGVLPPDKTAPDFVVIETVGDIPRNKKQAKEIQDEQTAKRTFKEKLRERFKDFKRGNMSKEEANKRLILYEQQRGICPYLGKELGENPFAHDLEIDHAFPRSSGGVSIMENLVLTHRKTNGDKGERTPYEAFGGKANSTQWQQILERIRQMQWNGLKREIFAWGTRAEHYDASGNLKVPEFGNMTRVAQLARQLRFEAARWMGIADDDAKVRQFIGTPTGYQTSVCREAWSEKLPADFHPRKNRNNLRHHMWDAAILSHIPPGKGMNHVRCGGIFDSSEDRSRDTALPDLGPDLKQFEAQTAGQCLVEKIQPAHNKQSRYQQTIYSPPDKDGIMWARDSLAQLAAKKDMSGEKLLGLLREAGISEKQLPTNHFNKWWDGMQARQFTRGDAQALLEALELPPQKAIKGDVLARWWGKGERKIISERSLRKLLLDADVTKDEVSDLRIQNALEGHADPGPLTRKDGTVIRGVSGSPSALTPMAVIPHRNHKRETIGFKLATESFDRAEIWTTEKRYKKGKIVKGKEDQPELGFHLRLIPHPRGLRNLRQRVLKCTNSRLAWERALTDSELIELGLGKKLEELKKERESLKTDYAKALATWESAQKKKQASDTLGLDKSKTGLPPSESSEPFLSLRRIYAGLPPHAKRLTNSKGVDVSRFAKGDLLLVPLNQVGDICKETETPYRRLWYRITAINANGQIEMKLAEYKQVKKLTEKEKAEGIQLSAEQEWLMNSFQQQPKAKKMAYLLRLTSENDQSPHSAK